MNIYSTVDKSNIDKIICMFNSVWENTTSKERLNFFLLTDEIPKNLPFIPEHLMKILTIRELNLTSEWAELLNNFNKNFYKNSQWCKSDMNFGRFLFFEIFPEVDRVLYLDWDMIVLGDIFEIINEYNDIENMVVAECGKTAFTSNIFTDIFRQSLTYEEIYLKRFNNKINRNVVKILNYLNIKVDDVKKLDGFNAGLYIVSKDQFEKKYLFNLINNLIKVQKKLKCFNFGTQVVMNFMHVKNRVLIPKVWNHLPSIPNLDSLKIIHYNGTEKPWNVKPDKKNIWLIYYNKIYPEWKYNKINLSNKNQKKEIIKEKVSTKKLNQNKKLIFYLR